MTLLRDGTGATSADCPMPQTLLWSSSSKSLSCCDDPLPDPPPTAPIERIFEPTAAPFKLSKHCDPPRAYQSFGSNGAGPNAKESNRLRLRGPCGARVDFHLAAIAARLVRFPSSRHRGNEIRYQPALWRQKWRAAWARGTETRCLPPSR